MAASKQESQAKQKAQKTKAKAKAQAVKAKKTAKGIGAQVEQQSNAVVRFMKSAYKITMDAGEDMSLRALDIPADIMQEMGVAEDKAKSFKQFNRKMVGGVYRGLDNMAETMSQLFTAPVKAVGNLTQRLKQKAAQEAPKLEKAVKAKKAAESTKVEKAAGKARTKAKAKTREAKATARKARTKAVASAKAVEKEVTEKLAA